MEYRGSHLEVPQLRESNRRRSKHPVSRFNDLDHTELVEQLERLAKVRSAVVARGRALVANPHYPEREVINEVSRVLAGKL